MGDENLKGRPIGTQELWDAITRGINSAFAEIYNHSIRTWAQYPSTDDPRSILQRHINSELKNLLEMAND